MKVLIFMSLLTAAFTAHGQIRASIERPQRYSQLSLADRAARIADKLSVEEGKLPTRDLEEVHYLTQRLESVLRISPQDDNGGSLENLICVSDGGAASFEKFTPYDTTSNKKIGSETSKDTCNRLIQSSKNNLICISDGGFASFERFTLFDLKQGLRVGSETKLNTCLRVLDESTRNFVCFSDGGFESFEKFTLFDRRNKKRIGGETSLENCLSSYKR